MYSLVIEGICGEYSIVEFCRKEGIADSTYCKWTKDFMEAGKNFLRGDTLRENNTTEVNELKHEKSSLKELVAELSLEKFELSSSELAWSITDTYRYYISESSLYRILKANGLVSVPAFRMFSASDSFKNQTTGVKASTFFLLENLISYIELTLIIVTPMPLDEFR